MDSSSSSSPEKQIRTEKNNLNKRRLHHTFFALAFSLLLFLLLSFSVLYVAVTIANLPIWSPISVPSNCTIVSTSVDLRSSKVCELGLLDYKAKHVFYPFERKKYRCHYDYYWASVFKVEYIDHSGKARVAFAEAPNEALPSYCRPSFGAAWLTKDKFRVNETYQCWYTLGISKVNINNEGLFDCQSEDPSTVEMLKRYYILFTRILKSWFFTSGSLRQWRWDVVTGLVTGFTTALLSVTLVGFLSSLIAMIRRLYASRTASTLPSNVLLKRACLFVAYVSFMSWITIQYVKRLGFFSI